MHILPPVLEYPCGNPCHCTPGKASLKDQPVHFKLMKLHSWKHTLRDYPFLKDHQQESHGPQLGRQAMSFHPTHQVAGDAGVPQHKA